MTKTSSVIGKSGYVQASWLDYLRKRWVILLMVSTVYFSYVTAFIKPWNIANFSLIDDGQVLIQNNVFFRECIGGLGCSKFIDQTLELGTGRYRPSYWVIQSLFYEIFGNNASAHHVFRAYFIGYISVVLLVLVLLNMGIGSVAILISSMLYFTNYSFSENVIRLGPNEPYQVIFAAIFALIYLSTPSFKNMPLGKYLGLIFIFIFTILIKETNIAIILSMLSLEFLIFRRRKIDIKFVMLVASPVVTLILIFLTKKYFPSLISAGIPVYTNNYLLNPISILKNSGQIIQSLFNSMSPFLKLTIFVLPLLLISSRARKVLLRKNAVFWFLFSAFFVGIMFPWKYLLDRYLLMGVFGLSVVIAITLSELLNIFNVWLKLFKTHIAINFLIRAFVILLLVNLFFRGLPVNLAKTINYAKWYAMFAKFEADQVAAISTYANKSVLINGLDNLNNWEVLYEIPIHLKYLHSQNFSPDLLKHEVLTGEYVFSRSAFDSFMSLEQIKAANSRLLDDEFYQVDQIDPLEFRNRFVLRPIHTLLNPPLKDGYEYYWEVRRVL